MILVVGATGTLGLEVCRRLRFRGRSVRALVRPGSSRTAELRQLGVDLTIGDLRVRSALEDACRGTSAVISTATAMGSKERSNSLRAVDRDGQLALIQSARAAHVQHFVYVSISPNYRERAPLMRYKREVERAVRASGMQWTILQPSNFMEIWLSSFLGWDFAQARAMIFGSGTQPISWISISDVAEYCVLAIDEPSMRDRDIPLGGPSALSPNSVVAIFEATTGRKFKVRRVPATLLRLLTPAVSLFNEKQASGMSLGAQSAEGDAIDSPLQAMLPVARTTVGAYAQRVAAPSNCCVSGRSSYPGE